MEIQIRLGTKEDLDQVENLYDQLNDYLARTTNYPGWKKGVYPVRQDAADGIQEGSLFVTVEGNEIVGSMILRHTPEPAYLTATWQASLEDSDVLLLYTFAVGPQKHQQGVGRKMLDFAAAYARSKGVKALCLDVYEKNTPAIRLYEKSDYRYIDTVSLGLEEIGLDRFKLYERLL